MSRQSKAPKVRTPEQAAREAHKRKMHVLHNNTLFVHRWVPVYYPDPNWHILKCDGKQVASRTKFVPHEMDEPRPVDGWSVVRLKPKNKVCKWAILDQNKKQIRKRNGHRLFFACPAFAILHAEKVAAKRFACVTPRNIGEMLAELKG